MACDKNNARMTRMQQGIRALLMENERLQREFCIQQKQIVDVCRTVHMLNV